MLLELISRYHKFLWWALLAFAFFKAFFSYAFLDIQGVNGILYSLVNWFKEEQQELEEYAPRRAMMRFLNLLTVAIYTIIFLIIASFVLLHVLGR